MIDRAALFNDPTLQAITMILVRQARPARIILFGSRARGDARADSDYDLVVEMPFDRTAYYAIRGYLANLALAVQPTADVDVLLREPGELEVRGDDPGFVEWNITREGIVLHPPEQRGVRLQPPLPPTDRVRERGPYPSIAVWLERAEDDRLALVQLLAAGTQPSWVAVCFHAHQYAEQHVKVLYIRRGVQPPHTHDLEKLITGLRPLGHALRIAAEDYAVLENYGVDLSPSSGNSLPTPAHGHAAAAAAERIVAAVRRALG